MAEFLNILAEQYDYPQLAEEVLRELSNKEFNNNDLKGPKSVSTFIARLSELAPRLVIKQVMLLAKLLDSEVCYFRRRRTLLYVLRTSLVLHSALCHHRSLRQSHWDAEQARG